MMKTELNIQVFKLPDNTYLAYSKEYKECTSHGETKKDALEALIKSIEFSEKVKGGEDDRIPILKWVSRQRWEYLYNDSWHKEGRIISSKQLLKEYYTHKKEKYEKRT